MRFWQAAEQNRRVPLREVSTKTRSQLSALQTPSRSAYPVADHMVPKLVGGETPRIADLEAAREPAGCSSAGEMITRTGAGLVGRIRPGLVVTRTL
jgi:hypothetical protein